MGWRWRKSVGLGPFRINLSKSGVGYSVGVKGFRIGQDAKGREYTATSIPGTGVYRRDYSAATAKSRPALAQLAKATLLVILGVILWFLM